VAFAGVANAVHDFLLEFAFGHMELEDFLGRKHLQEFFLVLAPDRFALGAHFVQFGQQFAGLSIRQIVDSALATHRFKTFAKRVAVGLLHFGFHGVVHGPKRFGFVWSELKFTADESDFGGFHALFVGAVALSGRLESGLRPRGSARKGQDEEEFLNHEVQKV